MKRIFADTAYFLALLNLLLPRECFHFGDNRR